jgi:glutamate-1-semialdehyde 2,1-aminomutase
MILGHAHPDVINEVKKSANDGASFGAPTKKEVILAEMIIDRVPGCDMLRLVNSGTEATMSAVRLARGISGKDKIIKFAGCYHGHCDSFLIEAGSGALTNGVPNSPGVTRGTAKDTLLAQFNDIQTVQDLFKKYASQIAAVIVEPVNGNTGCIPPEDQFLWNIRDLCSRHDALLIFDEVMTGFRISRGGASEYYSVIPDLFAFGKVIGGGLPIGAYGGKKELMEQVAPIGRVYQAGTLSGNPMAVTAGIETLKRLTHVEYEKLEKLGAYFEAKLQALIDTYDYPVCQKRVGSMFSLFFHPGPVRNAQDVSKCDFDAFKQFFHTLLDHGIYTAPSQYEAGFISLAHTEEILNKAITQVDAALKDVFVPA